MENEKSNIETVNSGAPEGMSPISPLPPITPEAKPPLLRKLRSDSVWSGLTPEQRQTMETWLFDENAGYKEVQARVLRDFGLTCSTMNVAAFYRRVKVERSVEEMAPALEAAADVNATGADVETLRASTLKLVAKRLHDAAIDGKEPRELAALNRLLQAGHERKIQQGWLVLARERFEFNASKAVLKALPLANEMMAEENAREDARLAAIKQKLFGRELPYMIE